MLQPVQPFATSKSRTIQWAPNPCSRDESCENRTGLSGIPSRYEFWRKAAISIQLCFGLHQKDSHPQRSASNFAIVFLRVVAVSLAVVVCSLMSSRFKIPKEIEDPAILLNGNSAKIIKKANAEAMCDLRDGRKPSARRCGFQKVRSDRWNGTRELEVYRLTNFGHADVPRIRSLSSRMSPRHPQSGGDFRRGAYHDLLDAGGDPTILTIWKGLPHNNFVGLDPELIQAIRDLSEEPKNASAV
jgi:hypothetical protein